jgi:F420-dependent oxidoreductase-like protein
MIEGQNGLNWTSWQKLALKVEELGFFGLFRSDHYTNANPPDQDSLELWTSLTWLASHTSKITFGPLVTPLSFRHPTMTARLAASVDDLSRGRLILGLGAGWQEREHTNYGWDLLPIPDRFIRFEEGLQVITALLQQDTPINFEGQYYRLNDAVLLPRPARPGGPPILVGGNGIKRTLPLASRYAQEWNAVYLSIPEFTERTMTLDELLQEEGRSKSAIRRSLMTGCVFGFDQQDLKHKVKVRTSGKRTPDELFQRDLIVGTASQVVQKLGEWTEAGISRVMLQWLDLQDLDGLEGFASQVLPQLTT